jgi:hypothetical protein
MSDWFSHMRRGDFAAAWEISDEILRARGGAPTWHLPRHEQAIWDGTPLHGRRVLIRCYHGLGDTIQFARFIPAVEAIASEVAVWAQPSLIPLLQTMNTSARFLPLHDGTPEVDYDADVEIMELAHVFRTTVETIPSVPYLHVAPADVPRGIGLVWRAGEWDPARSIPFEVFRPLLETPGVRFYPLHREDEGAGTPLETARLMRALDLVITVDTMAAHLAGALGVPVWTLLPAQCDWRWMDERSDTPWYPTMHLFRYASAMSEEEPKRSLEDWGIDVDKFKERAKESLESAKGDLSEITGTLRHTLVQAKDIVVGLQKTGSPAAAELKSGFERAWQEIENAFRSARQKAKGTPEDAAPTDEPPSPS